MITNAAMVDAFLEEFPEVTPQWNEIRDEWSDENDPPVYLALAAIARYLIARLEAGDETTPLQLEVLKVFDPDDFSLPPTPDDVCAR